MSGPTGIEAAGKQGETAPPPTIVTARYMWKQEHEGNTYSFNLLTRAENDDADQVDIFFHTADGAKFEKGKSYRVTIEEVAEG